MGLSLNVKWAGYIRESTEDQGKGYGPEVQTDFCLRTVKANNGQFCTTGIVAGVEHIEGGFIPPRWVYGDIGGHGWDIKRPGLEQMLKDASAKKFDALVVWRQDRLARTGDVMRIIEVLVSLGVQIYLEGKIYTSGDAMSVRVRAMVSEEELTKMGNAIAGGLQKTREAGTKLSRAPIGLRKTADKKGYEVDEIGESVVKMKPKHTDGDIANKLGLSVWQVKKIARNVKALNDGTIDNLLQKQREQMEIRKKKFKDARRAERKSFRDWLSEIAPGRWE